MRARALQYLAHREYSRAELRGKLMHHVVAGRDFTQSDESPHPEGEGSKTPSPQSSDKTTGETTSHLTRLSKDDSQVIGYSHSTRRQRRQVAGYPAYPYGHKCGRGSEREEQFSISESQRELNVNAVDALLDDLMERGWLSDARAVTQLLHAKRSRFGTRRIIHELHNKGIAEELINDVLPGLKESELEMAQSVWQKKFGALPHDARERARQMRFLQARGFSMDIIFQVLRHSESEDDEGDTGGMNI